MLGEEDDYRTPMSLARAKEAKAIFILNTRTAEEFKEYAAQFEKFLTGGRLSLRKPEAESKGSGVFFVSPLAAEKILGATVDRLAKAVSASSKKSSLYKLNAGKATYFTSVEVETVKSENVLGYLEGTDKKD